MLDTIPSFMSWLVDKIQSAVDALNQKIGEFWKQVNEFMTEQGSPSALRSAAETWSKHVSTIISDFTGGLSVDQLRSDNEWTGSAATAYKDTIPAQHRALNTVRGMAGQISTSLENIATALIAFYIAIVGALLIFIAGLVAAIILCCTGVGIPAGVGAIATTVGVVLGLIVAAATTLYNLCSTACSEQQALAGKLGDNSNFPHGSWPVSTTSLKGEWNVSE